MLTRLKQATLEQVNQTTMPSRMALWRPGRGYSTGSRRYYCVKCRSAWRRSGLDLHVSYLECQLATLKTLGIVGCPHCSRKHNERTQHLCDVAYYQHGQLMLKFGYAKNRENGVFYRIT